MVPPTPHSARRTSTAFISATLALSLGMTGCSAGLSSGIEYPDVSDVDLEGNVVSPEGDERASVTLSEFKFAPETCTGIDTTFAKDDIDQEDLTRFLNTRGLPIKPKRARDDLWWFEVENKDDPGDENVLRLRLAVSKDRYAAAKDLHDSLLQHGPGWWGVRRGNLALLAPRASLSKALRFAIKYKLVCWGMFTYAGVDDVYVVAGGYTEW